jgi:large subunit ribosomal protein L22
MEAYKAKAKYLKVSPTKVRPIIDLIRGHKASRVVEWLKTHPNRRTVIVLKVIGSAIANAVNVSGIRAVDYKLVVAKVDQGPTQKYAIPGAMGRSVVRRRRFSHVEIWVQPLGRTTNLKEARGGTES